MKPIVVLAACAALAACSAAHKPTSQSPDVAPSAVTSATTKPSISPGESASIIAAAIAGCSDVKVGNPGKCATTGLASTATCTLNGREIIVDSFGNVPDADISKIVAVNKRELWYVQGPTWTVFVADEPTLQMQLTNDGGGLLKYAVDTPLPPLPNDIDGQQRIADQVVASIGGHKAHAT